MSNPRVTVFQLDPIVGPDRFTDWLPQVGLRHSLLDLDEKQVPQLSAVGDGIIILGGRMSALERRPWSDDLVDLVADALSIDIPILGICLGHQLLAHWFGGEVTVGGHDEEGPVEVTWLPAAADDPVVSALAAAGPSMVAQSHHDMVTRLPDGAIELARSDAGNQAFRVGTALGVQFHPEASPALIGRWADGHGGDGAAMQAAMEAVDDQVAANGKALLAGFAEVVRA